MENRENLVIVLLLAATKPFQKHFLKENFISNYKPFYFLI